MIFLPTHQLLIATPPKCATSSLHAALCSGYGGQHLIGPTAHDPGISWHTTAVPATAAEWRIAAVVREPFDRLVSLYHQLGRYHVRMGWAVPSFADFVNLACTPGVEFPLLYRHNLSTCLDGLAFNRVLRFESLEADLQREGITVFLPRENASHRLPAAHYWNLLDEAGRELADAWIKPDRFRFGYA